MWLGAYVFLEIKARSIVNQHNFRKLMPEGAQQYIQLRQIRFIGHQNTCYQSIRCHVNVPETCKAPLSEPEKMKNDSASAGNFACTGLSGICTGGASAAVIPAGILRQARQAVKDSPRNAAFLRPIKYNNVL
jgi:hypothetical protein